jgi:hypothetical protein
MLSLLAVWTFATSRRLFQIGIIAAGVGSGFIGLGAIGMVVRRGGPRPAADPARGRLYPDAAERALRRLTLVVPKGRLRQMRPKVVRLSGDLHLR